MVDGASRRGGLSGALGQSNASGSHGSGGVRPRGPPTQQGFFLAVRVFLEEPPFARVGGGEE
eukprot:3766331-Lingulodinium_polyedra.AAC.1